MINKYMLLSQRYFEEFTEIHRNFEKKGTKFMLSIYLYIYLSIKQGVSQKFWEDDILKEFGKT